MCQNLRPKHHETNTNNTSTISTKKMSDLIGHFISTTGESGINRFLKLFVLNKDAISLETVEFSGKIRSRLPWKPIVPAGSISLHEKYISAHSSY